MTGLATTGSAEHVASSAQRADVLTADGIRMSFGGVVALDNVSVAVREDELLAVIGPNGAGKTSLMNCLSGFYRPQQGRISFLGRDIADMPVHAIARAGLARTFQGTHIFSGMSVIENIMVGRHIHMRSSIPQAFLYFHWTQREETRHREVVEEIIEFLEIEDLRDHTVGTLSYGQQKRVELGRALAISPKLLLLDEMVSGMNQEEREDIARFILDLKDELGMTVFMVEHDMGIVMDISDHVCVVNHGRKIAEGAPSEIAANPAVIEAYLGTKRAAA